MRLNRAAVVRVLSVAGIMLIYAACFAAIKAGLAFAPPLRFGGLRALIGGLALLGLMKMRREPMVPARALWPRLLVIALTATTITFGAMFLSPGRMGAGIASVLGNMQPLMTLLLAALFLGEALTRGKVVALLLGVIGVTLIAYRALTAADAYGLSGALLALAVSASSATSNVIAKRMGTNYNPLSLTAWQLTLGSLPLLIISAVVERDATSTWNIQFTALLLFLALVGTSLAIAAWYWLVQREDVGRLTLFFFLVPVFGLVVAALIFGEAIGPLEASGAALIAVGIVAMAWESWRDAPSPASGKAV